MSSVASNDWQVEVFYDGECPLCLREIGGSNGAGKSTFFKTFLSNCGLRFVNADA